MTRRDLNADVPGPVTIDAELLRQAGKVSVRVDPECQRATVVISTADNEGPAADAVARATLDQSPDGVLSAKVQGARGGGSGVAMDGNGNQFAWGNNNVVQTSNSRGRSIRTGNGVRISNVGDGLTINGVRVSGSDLSATPAPAPIEITAVVPPGSALSTRTQSADIEATGLDTIEARTESGSVEVGAAFTVSAQTESGSISVGWARDLDAKTASGQVSAQRVEGKATVKSTNGSVSIREFAGNEARLSSASGNASAHVASSVTDGARIVRVGSISGNATVTTENAGVAQNLDAQATSITGRASGPQSPAQRPLHQSGPGNRDFSQRMPGPQGREGQGY